MANSPPIEPDGPEWEALMRSAAATPPGEPGTDASWRAVTERLQLASPVKRHPSVFRITGPRLSWLVGGAALLGVCATFAALWRYLPSSAVPRGRDYTVAAAERERVVLSDGTEAVLAPGSRLRLASDFGGQRRDVFLEGEAYFSVFHDALHPFAVHARNAIAQDVGTHFDVRAYPESPTVQVAVTEGQVNLLPAGVRPSQVRALRAGDVAELADTTIVVTRGADAGNDTAWVAGDLRFRDTPLPEAAALLGRWYDLDIDASDPALATREVTLSAGHTSVDDLLTGVAAATHARVVRHGRHVTFTADPRDE